MPLPPKLPIRRKRQKARLSERRPGPFAAAMLAAAVEQAHRLEPPPPPLPVARDAFAAMMRAAQVREEKRLGTTELEDGTAAVCIKAGSLRKMTPRSYENLRHWMADPRNVYVGRYGRIFIKDPKTGETAIYHYKGSKWGNPFTVEEHGLAEALRRYKAHLYSVRPDGTRLVDQIEELRGKKLGCFCDQSQPCHAQILVDALKD
jgi:hypothetical protein